MTVLSIYSVACFATRAAVALVSSSRDAAEHFGALNMAQMLVSSLVISTDSLLLHQYLELLARLASITGSSRVMMDIHRARVMPAVIAVVRKDTWRRHLHPFFVLVLLFSEHFGLLVPHLDWTSDVIETMIDVFPTGAPELDKLAHRCMLDLEAALAMPYDGGIDSVSAGSDTALALDLLRSWLHAHAWQSASEASPMQSQRASQQGRAMSLQGHWQGAVQQQRGRGGHIVTDTGQQTDPPLAASMEGTALTQITELADVSPPNQRSAGSSSQSAGRGRAAAGTVSESRARRCRTRGCRWQQQRGS